MSKKISLPSSLPMRILEKEKNAIVNAVRSVDPEARVYLFGSRTDEAKHGGDIDILILSHKITLQDKLNIKASIFQEIEEQKIDFVIVSDTSKPFVRMVLKESEELT